MATQAELQERIVEALKRGDDVKRRVDREISTLNSASQRIQGIAAMLKAAAEVLPSSDGMLEDVRFAAAVETRYWLSEFLRASPAMCEGRDRLRDQIDAASTIEEEIRSMLEAEAKAAHEKARGALGGEGVGQP